MVNKEELLKDVLIYDIECYSSADINQEFKKYVETAKIKWIGFYSYKSEKYYEIPVLGNEELIKNFMDEHRVIVGFNNDEFDDPITKNNNLWPGRYKISLDIKKILSPELGCKNRGYLMGFNFKKHSLAEMSKTMGAEVEKGDIDYEIFKKDIFTEEEKKEIKKYLKRDIELTKFMFEKAFNFFSPFADFVSEENVKNWSWLSSSEGSLAYKYACNITGVKEEYGEKGEKTDGGGKVIEPRVEEETDVFYCDVVSLYPHMYIMFSLFSEVPEGTPGAWHGNDIFKVRGYYDFSQQHILSRDMAFKLAERVRLKKEDPKNPLVYAYKIILNSLYGANRSAVFKNLYTDNSGYDCCYLGRQVNDIMENKMTEKGYKIISGDTDSIFVKYLNGSRTKEEVRKDLEEIGEFIKSHSPFPVDTFKIDIEAKIDYIRFVSDDEKEKTLKKNYFYIYEKDGKKQVKIMGLPIKKENSTLLGPLILEKYIIPRILAEKSGRFEKSWIINIIEEEVKKDITLMAQEYSPSAYDSYSGLGRNCLSAQISREYLSRKSGKIKLIKNKIIGKVGKKFKYCSIEEANNYKLQYEDLDLTKVFNELSPFCLEKLDFKEVKKKNLQKNGFFSSQNSSSSGNQLTLRGGFF